MIQLCCHFTGTGSDFVERADVAVRLLAEQPTCRTLRLGRSTEDPAHWILTAEFDSVPGYRAALSPMAVRITVIPFLSEADQSTSGVFEVHLAASDGSVSRLATIVSYDADRPGADRPGGDRMS